MTGSYRVATGRAGSAAWVGQGERARELLRPVESPPELVRPGSQVAWLYTLLGDLDV